jgi:hypothetical protein
VVSVKTFLSQSEAGIYFLGKSLIILQGWKSNINTRPLTLINQFMQLRKAARCSSTHG